MATLSNIISLIFPFFGIIFMGFIAAKIIPHPESGLKWMNIFIIYFALPAMFFKLISQTPFEELQNWPFIIATTLATLTIFAVSFLYGMAKNGGKMDVAAIQAVGGAYGNIGYMAPGLTLTAFGPLASVPTALIFCFDNSVHFTLVPLFVAIGRGEKRKIILLFAHILKKILLHPFILATIIGVMGAYFQIKLPDAGENILNALAGAAAPCALFVMGVTVSLRSIKRITADVPVLVFIKLILHPFIMLIFLSLFGPFDEIWVYTAILIAALPQALNVFVLAQQYNIFVERASSIILIGTIGSIFTLTILLYLIKSGHVPISLF